MCRIVFKSGKVDQHPARTGNSTLRLGLWVAILSVVVKLCSLPRALRIVSASTRAQSQAGAGSEEELVTKVDAILGSNIFLFRPVCWKRAAILHRHLSVRDRATTKTFGLRKGPGNSLDGHAWLDRWTSDSGNCDSRLHCYISLSGRC